MNKRIWLGYTIGSPAAWRICESRPKFQLSFPIDHQKNPNAARFNLELEKIADSLPSLLVWDTVETFQNMQAEFIDERAAVAKGIRLSNGACIELARSLSLVRLPTALIPRIKAVAVDLDNTLYEGILGEDAVEGVHISAKHGAIHKELPD